MIEVSKQAVIKNLEQIPNSKGIFCFSKPEEILFIRKSSNLRKTIKNFLIENIEDKNVFQMMSLTKTISWLETSSFFEALVNEKKMINKENPEYNNLIRDYEDYVYLGINFHKVPYFNITNDTLEDLYYLGPFIDRFFLYDYIATMGELFQMPVCEEENFPCDRYKTKRCLGYCLKDSREITELILNSFLQKDEKILSRLSRTYEELYDDLEFEKTEILKLQKKLIEKYYKVLKFLHIVKNLTLEYEEKGVKYSIKKGVIVKMSKGKEFYYFGYQTPEYRENELLAINKNQLGESWIIYNHLKKKYSQKFNNIYLESFSKIKSKFK